MSMKADAEKHGEKAASADVITQTGRDAPRGCGATTAQIKHADQGAIYVCRDRVEYAKDIARRLNRTDIMFWPETSIQPSESYRFNGLPHGKQIVIDHAIKIDPEVGAFLYRISDRYRITQFCDLPAIVRDALVNGVPEVQRSALKPMPKFVAEIVPYNPVNGTGIIIRSEQGKLIGRLKLSVPQTDDPQQMRKDAQELCAFLERKLNGDASYTPELPERFKNEHAPMNKAILNDKTQLRPAEGLR